MRSLDFLKSEVVAKVAAKRIKEQLGERVSTANIRVSKSPRYPGTWRVDVYRIDHAPVSYVNQQLNRQANDAIAAAIKAAFRPADLVDSWTRPRR